MRTALVHEPRELLGDRVAVGREAREVRRHDGGGDEDRDPDPAVGQRVPADLHVVGDEPEDRDVDRAVDHVEDGQRHQWDPGPHEQPDDVRVEVGRTVEVLAQQQPAEDAGDQPDGREDRAVDDHAEAEGEGEDRQDVGGVDLEHLVERRPGHHLDAGEGAAADLHERRDRHADEPDRDEQQGVPALAEGDRERHAEDRRDDDEAELQDHRVVHVLRHQRRSPGDLARQQRARPEPDDEREEADERRWRS